MKQDKYKKAKEIQERLNTINKNIKSLSSATDCYGDYQGIFMITCKASNKHPNIHIYPTIEERKAIFQLLLKRYEKEIPKLVEEFEKL